MAKRCPYHRAGEHRFHDDRITTTARPRRQRAAYLRRETREPLRRIFMEQREHALYPPGAAPQPTLDWWHGRADERYWCEVTERDDVGADLNCPQANEKGRPFWGYELVQIKCSTGRQRDLLVVPILEALRDRIGGDEGA